MNKEIEYTDDEIRDVIGDSSQYTFGEFNITINRNSDELIIFSEFDQLYVKFDEEYGPHFEMRNNDKKSRIVNLPFDELLKLSLPEFQRLGSDELEEKKSEYAISFVESKNMYVNGLLNRIYKMGFEVPYVVQKIAIPEIIIGNDVLVNFKAGQGKTLAFMVGCLWQFDPNNPDLQCVFISNTHEVATQTYKQLVNLVPNGTKISLVVGHKRDESSRGGFEKTPSVRVNYQEELSGVQIIVATVGKLYDVGIKRKYINFKYVKTLLIDEFDNIIVPKNNRQDINVGYQVFDIINSVNKYTQRLFFSATNDYNSLKYVIHHFRKDDASIDRPLVIMVPEDDITLQSITQYYALCENYDDKLSTLQELLKYCRISQCIIFVNEINAAEAVSEYLRELGYDNESIHGQLSDDKRKDIYGRFAHNKIRYLVSTSLLARGVDVSTVDFVINFDMPKDVKDYTHRIARAGRKGSKGIAINLVLERESKKIDELNKEYSKNSIKLITGDLSLI